MEEEQRITICKTSLNQISSMLRERPEEWRNYITLARTIIVHLNGTTFMRNRDRVEEQVWAIGILQRLAYADIDSGSVDDIARWCSNGWLVVWQNYPNNVAALQGIGQAWLARAQPLLATIHREEGGSSSSGSSSRSRPSMESNTDGDTNWREDAERRVGTSRYVEARGYLEPATDYLEQAVRAATSQQLLSGHLLATVSIFLSCDCSCQLSGSRLRRHTCPWEMCPRLE